MDLSSKGDSQRANPDLSSQSDSQHNDKTHDIGKIKSNPKDTMIKSQRDKAI